MQTERPSRTYSLCRLLEHGALTLPQLREITGWSDVRLDRGLQLLIDTGRVRPEYRRFGGNLYHLESHAQYMRRLQDRLERQQWHASAGAPSLQPGVPRVRRQIPLSAQAQTWAQRGAFGRNAARAQHVDGVRARRGEAARHGGLGVEALGGVGA